MVKKEPRCDVIEAAGGSVEIDNALSTMFASQRVTYVTVPAHNIRSVGIKRMSRFPNLTVLRITHVEVKSNYGLLETSEMRITKITEEVLESLDHAGRDNSH